MQVEYSRHPEAYKHTMVMQDIEKSVEDKALNLRYLHADEVNEKRQKFLLFKMGFFTRQEHLKFNGQKQHTMILICQYIDDNIDKLFKNRDRQKLYSTSAGSNKKNKAFQESLKTFENLPQDQLTDRQKTILFVEKRKYAEYLKQEAEQAIKDRRHKIWIKHIGDTYKECDKSVGFAQKNTFIEDRIEMTQKYFGYLNDFDNNNAGVSINKIKKELFKFQRKSKNKQRQLQRADPIKIL